MRLELARATHIQLAHPALVAARPAAEIARDDEGIRPHRLRVDLQVARRLPLPAANGPQSLLLPRLVIDTTQPGFDRWADLLQQQW